MSAGGRYRFKTILATVMAVVGAAGLLPYNGYPAK
jgi:hypothetical protein